MKNNNDLCWIAKVQTKSNQLENEVHCICSGIGSRSVLVGWQAGRRKYDIVRIL